MLPYKEGHLKYLSFDKEGRERKRKRVGERKGMEDSMTHRFQQYHSLSEIGIYVHVDPFLCESSEGKKFYFCLYIS